jgi:V8-like Glu-specific endopeptidase
MPKPVRGSEVPGVPRQLAGDRLRRLVMARSRADQAGVALESVSVEEVEPPGAADVTGRVEEAARRMPGREDLDERDFGRALDLLLRTTDRAVRRLDANPDAPLPPDEVYALEAVVRVDGTRPSLLLRKGAADREHPLAAAWAGQLTAAGDRLSTAIAAIGRVEPAHSAGSDYFGTCWVVDHRNGLVLTNRHVLKDMARRLPHPVPRKSTRFPVPDGAFVDFAAESGSADVRRYRVVEAIQSTVKGLDAAVLRIEPMPDGPQEVPHAITVSVDPDGPLGRLASYCIVGYPAAPRYESGTVDGVDWAWVTRTLFGNVYGVKRLAPGTTHRPLGSLTGDQRGWVFGHDATTLGGNSGSPALAWSDSSFGLHFAGRSVDTNHAHAFSAIAAELSALGVPIGGAGREAVATAAQHAPRPEGVPRAAGDDAVTTRNWRVEFTRVADTFDWDDLHVLSTQYVEEINGRRRLDGEKVREVKAVLDVLRTNLRYEDLELVADAALAHDLAGSAVRRLYAQALVDGHNPALALLVYQGLVKDRSAAPDDRIDARGGVGRCYKELFLAGTDQHRRREHLEASIRWYLRTFEKYGKTYPGIDAVALLARAAREGIEPDDTRARSTATAILAEVNNALVDDGWGEPTACEALIALGRNEEALVRAEAFLNTKPAAFHLASFLRQLTEVWQLSTADELGSTLLPQLRSALLAHTGGQVVVEPRDISARRLHQLDTDTDTQLQAIIGTTRYRNLHWYKKGLARCRAVARILGANREAVGTGFLMKGSALHPDLPALVLVTNGHVIPEKVPADHALVVFHGVDEDAAASPEFRVARTCWYQPSADPGLDTTIVELAGRPNAVKPLPVAKPLGPAPTQDQRAYVIGHPRGLDQPQFSLQDNILLEYNDRVLRYRSPTEDGSSGSPVFDDNWDLIGLHHATGRNYPRLNGGGTHPANEGIRLDAIRTKLRHDPPKATERG